MERLRYRSNLLGADPRITNTGGGNTSSKVVETDPLTGKEVEVLWVKGSGGDLRTATRKNFASLYLEKLLFLETIYNRTEPRGPKSEIEDQMVDLYRHAVFDLNPVACSIDTPLHGLIPYRHVDHTHPVAIIAVAASRDQERLTRDIFGDEVAWIPWQRPGFDLGVVMQQALDRNPGLKGCILGQHGLINWAEDDKACYELTLGLVEKASRYLDQHQRQDWNFGGQKVPALESKDQLEVLTEILPRLRGMVAQSEPLIATVESSAPVLQFVNSVDAPRLAELGTSCPDHFLRTKIKPLYVDWKPDARAVEELVERLEQGLAKYRMDYSAYYESCKHPDSPADAQP